MAPHFSPTSAVSPRTEDIDSRLLRGAQAYLECRSRRQAPCPEWAEAWERFYRTCDPLIRRLAATCRVPPADLNDCGQEVWAALVTRLPDFRCDSRRGRLISWLYALVRSKATDLVRRRTRHPEESLTREKAVGLSSAEADPAAEYERHRLHALVRGVLDELRQHASECSYRVLYMHSIEGYPIHEIAAALHLTPEQVRFRHHFTKKEISASPPSFRGGRRAFG